MDACTSGALASIPNQTGQLRRGKGEMSTTDTELSIPQATTAVCDACGQTGNRAEMTYDGAAFYCGSELAAREAGDLQRFVSDVEACTQRQIEAESRRKAQAAQQAAEAALEDAGDETPETVSAEAPAGAEDAPEAGESA
jgi:hypothetical protein